MPQLDISTFSSQLFWLGVCFLVLYFILSYVALPRVAHLLEAREKTLEKKIAAASRYREEAEALLSAYEAALAKARREAQEKHQETVRTLSLEMAHRQKDFLDTIKDRLQSGGQGLSRARLEAKESLEGVSVDVAKAILEKLTGRPYTLDELKW